ncbi:unnamed protein product, partial [Albugo candida]
SSDKFGISSDDDKVKMSSSQDQDTCAVAHYPPAHFLQSMVIALKSELKGLEVKLAEFTFDNRKLRTQLDRLLQGRCSYQ